MKICKDVKKIVAELQAGWEAYQLKKLLDDVSKKNMEKIEVVKNVLYRQDKK